VFPKGPREAQVRFPEYKEGTDSDRVAVKVGFVQVEKVNGSGVGVFEEM